MEQGTGKGGWLTRRGRVVLNSTIVISDILPAQPTTTMGTAGGYNGGNGAVTEGREGFPERIHIIGSTHPLLTDFQATL